MPTLFWRRNNEMFTAVYAKSERIERARAGADGALLRGGVGSFSCCNEVQLEHLLEVFAIPFRLSRHLQPTKPRRGNDDPFTPTISVNKITGFIWNFGTVYFLNYFSTVRKWRR